MAEALGFEPRMAESKSAVIPFHYTPKGTVLLSCVHFLSSLGYDCAKLDRISYIPSSDFSILIS